MMALRKRAQITGMARVMRGGVGKHPKFLRLLHTFLFLLLFLFS